MNFRLLSTRIFFPLLLTYCLGLNVYAQSDSAILSQLDSEIDSIKSSLDTIQNDEDKIQSMIWLGWKYYDRGRPNNQLSILLEARSLAESLNLPNKLGDVEYALGVFYNRQNKDQEAIDHCRLSLKLHKETKDSLGIGAAAHRLGLAFYSLNVLDSAQQYLQLSYNIRKIYNYKYPVAASSNALGLVFLAQDSVKKASEYFLTAYSLWSELGDNEGVAIVAGNIGTAFRMQNNYPEAIQYYKESIAAAHRSNALIFKKESALELSNTYESLGKLDSSIKYLKLFIQANDSIFNSDEQSKILDLQEKYHTLENEKTILQQSNELAENAWKFKLLIVIIVFILLVLVLLFYGFHSKRKANEKLAEQKIQIEEQNEELNQQNEEIISISDMVESQNRVLKNRNEEIMDSIQYAKTIQQGILPALTPLKSHFTNAFVFFKPKEVVSGDFYWIYENKEQNQLIWAVADCTGHGVPGALMSMVGYNGLNKLIQGQRRTQPSEILEKLCSHTIRSISNEDTIAREESLKDGMDIALCTLDLSTNILQFSGAFNSCYIIRNEELIELKGTRRPIGQYWAKNKKLFKQHEIQLKSDDWIILSSDGYPDQFGGPFNKKLGYPAFRETLCQIDQHSQKPNSFLEETFLKWKRSSDQIDDLCILGIKV